MNLPTIAQLSFPSFYHVMNRFFSNTQYVMDHAQYCYSSDPMFTIPVKNRTATSLIGGRILAQKLAEQSALTLDILTGEMGGAPPLPDDHPLKAAAVEATFQILHAGWSLARRVADGQFTLDMDQQLIADSKLPGFIPATLQYVDEQERAWTATFCAMDLIYTLAGGQFTVPAGMAFHYKAEHVEKVEELDARGEILSTQFTVEVYFQGVPESDRLTQIDGLRQLITDRNHIFETLANAAVVKSIERILGDLKEQGLLSDEIINAAKAYDEAAKAAAVAANDAASVKTATP